jgi:hypothetical protein
MLKEGIAAIGILLACGGTGAGVIIAARAWFAREKRIAAAEERRALREENEWLDDQLGG